MNKPRILIVEDEPRTREGLRIALEEKYDVLTAEDGETGLEILRSTPVDIVLTDLRMPGIDGLTFIKRATSLSDPPLVIMLTAYGTLQDAVTAMKLGAYDYLMKPVDLDNLEMVINRGLEARRLQEENESLRRELDERHGLKHIIGQSRAMIEILETVRQVAPTRSTVLITGESGVGKEVIARAIHQLSPRAQKPFVVVHCGALNPNLLESELFGHEKGAFTGAHERRIGRFEAADGGTIFLDEIGEIDMSIQIKLLRVLETRTFERVGGSAPIEVDVRVITATHRDLKALVDAGRFREDLYYRLNVVRIHIPPLRERREDIPLLLNHYVRRFAEENGKVVNGFTKEAVKILSAYSWPGNVRELRNAVERMVVMARGTSLTLSDVPAEIRQAVAEELENQPPGPAASGAAPESSQASDSGTTDEPRRWEAEAPRLDITENERRLILKALDECDGNRTRAARLLGISRRTLIRKLHKYGIA